MPSNDSNDPIQQVTLTEVTNNTRVVINTTDYKAYVFVGNTPRAQLAIELDKSLPEWTIAHRLLMIFPIAKFEYSK